MSGARHAVLIALVAATVTSPAAAQVVRVRTLEEGTGRPTPGALVSLRDADGRAVAQALADAAGRVVLNAGRAGAYRVRVDRIGYQGLTLGPVRVAVGDTLALDAIVPAVRVMLPDLAVVSRAPPECQLESAAGELVASLWTEARKALLGTELTQSRPPLLEVSRYERAYGPEGSVVDETSSRARSRGDDPFVAADPARLARDGFHQRDGVAHIFFAPDARVLLSEEFLAQHCFQPVTAPGDSLLIGLAFAPSARHRKRTDVAGTLWLDRASAELRYIEFEYLNVDRRLRSGADQGRIDFVRLPDGDWVVGRWRARVGFRERGGEVAVIGPDGASPPAGSVVAGVAFDSVAGTPLPDVVVTAGSGYVDTTGADGVYRIAIPTEGRFSIRAEHPRFDLLGLETVHTGTAVIRGQEVRVDFAVPSAATLAGRACVRRPLHAASEGLVAGRLMDSTGRARPGLVRARWKAQPTLRAGYRLTISERGVEVLVPTDGNGRFRICGVPAGVPVDIFARGHEAETKVASAAAGGVALVHLVIPPDA